MYFVVLSWDELKVHQNLPDSDYEIYMVHLLVATANRHKSLQFAKKYNMTLLPCLTSNVEITCHYNLSLTSFIPINVKKKGRYFYSFQEMLGNLYERTRVEVIKTPSMSQVDGQGWADLDSRYVSIKITLQPIGWITQLFTYPHL